MPSKYDTNPLDPDFPEKIKAEAEKATATQYLPAQTRPFAPESEDATRRFSPDMASAYTSPASSGVPAPIYQNVSAGNADRSIERKVAKIGLPENILTAVPYIPWFLGFVAAVLLLLLTPKSEGKVRFHAAQGMAAHVGIFVVSLILGILGNVTNIGNTAENIFTLVTSITLVLFAYKAFRGKPIHIESIESQTNFLEEKIGPLNT